MRPQFDREEMGIDVGWLKFDHGWSMLVIGNGKSM
jgi:hypothetical protein